MPISQTTRTFKFKDKTLPDPNSKWTETEVKRFYANEYPELTNSAISEPIVRGSTAEYEFQTNLGTKG